MGPGQPAEGAAVAASPSTPIKRLAWIARAAIAAFLATNLVAPPAAAGEPLTARVIFRVTLSGPVPRTDTFLVSHRCPTTSCFVETLSPVCAPDAPFDACAAGTYELVRRVPIGETIEYALWRSTSFSQGHPERHLRGDWVVHEGTQVISLGYAYPTTDEPAVPSLPDTALPVP